MQMVFLISLFGSMSLEESRLDTILAQIFDDNSSAIQSTAADFPPGYTTCTKLSPSHSSRVGWMPCAFSIWEPGLGEGVLVLPALKPSLKVDLLQPEVSVNLNFTLWPAPEGQGLISSLCWMLRSCLHALSMPVSVLPALRNTIKRLFWRLTTKQALLAPHLHWDFLNAELFFTSRVRLLVTVLHHLCHNSKIPGLQTYGLAETGAKGKHLDFH